MTDRIARVVADADVLAADLLVGAEAREALDVVRSHSWIVLLASDRLLDDAEAVIAAEADRELARDWRETVTALVEPVEHPAGDHPALASASRGDAAHVLSFDEDLQSPRAGAAISRHVDVSVKSPDAFLHTFDPEVAHEVLFDEPYPGPDRDPRA